MRIKFYAVLFFGVLGLTSNLKADNRSKVFFCFQGGMGSVLSPSELKSTDQPPGVFGIKLGGHVSDRWSAGAQYSNHTINPTDLGGQTIRLLPVGAWVQRDYVWVQDWTPFTNYSLGVSRNASASRTKTGFMAGAGLGLRYRLSEWNEISTELGFDYFTRATPTTGRGTTVAHALFCFRFYLPESWIPVKPTVDITMAELEVPLVSQFPDPEIDETVLMKNELDTLQTDMDQGRIPPIAYEPGSAVLLTSSFEALDTVGTILRTHPKTGLRVYGFVEESYQGNARNALSKIRADVVRTYLIQNFRLNEAQVSTYGLKEGETTPFRRMEFEVKPK